MNKRLFLLLLPLIVLSAVGARRRATNPPAGPTFNREVVRILQQNCQSCHHEGDIAPFPLMTYRDAAQHAFEIKINTGSRRMPPWKAAAGCGEFQQVRAMSDNDIRTLAQWVEAGAPEGDPADLPKPIAFTGGWPLGQPDIVLSMPKAFTPPNDRDEYRCFSIPVPSTIDVAAKAIDFRPGDRATVHHIVPFLDLTGASALLDKNGTGYTCFGGPNLQNLDVLGGWSPGSRPIPLPSGTALVIPGKSRIVMQVHYHPHSLQVLPDQTQIGIYTTNEPIQHRLHYDLILNENFVLKAGNADARVDADATVSSPIHLVSIYPHMHLLGKKMNIEAVMPDGGHACLIDVPQYEFNWQGQYLYRNPVTLPAGSRIHIEAHFDNSADNVLNPNSPPRDVRFGEASTDEMCVALVGYTVDGE